MNVSNERFAKQEVRLFGEVAGEDWVQINEIEG